MCCAIRLLDSPRVPGRFDNSLCRCFRLSVSCFPRSAYVDVKNPGLRVLDITLLVHNRRYVCQNLLIESTWRIPSMKRMQ